MSRGYFAIGIEGGKTPVNLGTLWRSAHALGAAFIFTIGHRYPDRCQPTDTTKARRHIPLFQYPDAEWFHEVRPEDCELILVDCGQGKPKPLPGFKHPERAVYVLGSEDKGVGESMLAAPHRMVEIPSEYCLNVAVAGSIVMYDRLSKCPVSSPVRETP